MILRDDKNYIDHKTTKLYSTLFIYLFIFYMNIQNDSSIRLYNRLQSVNGLWCSDRLTLSWLLLSILYGWYRNPRSLLI